MIEIAIFGGYAIFSIGTITIASYYYNTSEYQRVSVSEVELADYNYRIMAANDEVNEYTH